jgi:uncharacterized integral membrane protein (TIGR00698 family)
LENKLQIKMIPGLALVAVLAYIAFHISALPAVQSIGFSALTVGILLGMLVGNTLYSQVAQKCHDGVGFSKQKLLRLGVIMFGFKLTFADIASVGWSGILIDTLTLSSTFFLAYWIGHKKLKMDEQSAILIGAGSSICGAAAVLATEPIIKAKAEKVAVAVATVVVYGTIAMFLWPLLYPYAQQLGFDARSFGIFEGSTIHEVAQVAVAGQSVGDDTMKTAVITKMIRVIMLAPFLIAVASFLVKNKHEEQDGKNGSTIPWFAVIFLVVIGFNSLALLPVEWVRQLVWLDNVLLVFAMSALGLTTHIGAIRQAGLRPLLLAFILFVWLLVGGSVINIVVNHFAGVI